jgi:osmotically inducible lipoprotein OsmB
MKLQGRKPLEQNILLQRLVLVLTVWWKRIKLGIEPERCVRRSERSGGRRRLPALQEKEAFLMKKNLKVMIAGLGLIAMLSGCAGMNPREQRMLSGGAMGAAGGAAIGAVTGGSPAVGAAVGGAAGVVGGLIVDEMDRRR